MKKNKFFYHLIIILIKLFFKICYRHKVYGREHFPEGSGIIAPNHASYLDPPCVAISCPGEIYFLARQTLFKSWFGKLISALNAHPILENGTNLHVIKEVCTLLKKGCKVLVFPEGTRSRDNQLAEIKPGIGLLVAKSESTIIPTYVHGTFDIWNRSRKFPKLRGKSAVVFGTPICWEDFADMERKEAQVIISQQLTSSLHALRKWYEEGHQGTPP